MSSLAIIGTQGIPAKYGGFETLAEQLVRFHDTLQTPVFESIKVYCSSDFDISSARQELSASGVTGVELCQTRWKANGWQSIFHDLESIVLQLSERNSVALCLGVSGAAAFPLLKIFGIRTVVNTDGVEYRRAKWGLAARTALRFLEKCSIWFADELIADNQGIADYLRDQHRADSTLIAYGGDHVLAHNLGFSGSSDVRPAERSQRLPFSCLSVCRIEPENHVKDVLEAVASQDLWTLDFVGDWSRSEYARSLKASFSESPFVRCMEPVWIQAELWALRRSRLVYIHGHESGGTNPSLVEAMWSGAITVCFDCVYNRNTTKGHGFFFSDAETLVLALATVEALSDEDICNVSCRLIDVAKSDYSWEVIGHAYLSLLKRPAS